MTKRTNRTLAIAGAVLLNGSIAFAQETPAAPTPAPSEAPTASADALAEQPELSGEQPVESTMPEAAVAEQSIEPAVSEASAEPAAPAALTGYKKGFFISSEDGLFDVHIQQRVQTRFVFEAPDSGDNEHALSIARARLTFAGHAFTKGLSYKFQTDLGKGFVDLKDFYGDYELSPNVVLRAGQFKRPFSRQQITSSGSQELVDRSITDKFFGGGRDIGVMLHNEYEHSPEIEWAVGVFNGTGDKPHFSGAVVVDPMTGEGSVTGGSFSNVPTQMHPAVVARVGYNHNGIKGYSEADLEGGPMRMGVAASTLVDLDADNDDKSGIRAQADYVVKAEGFSTTGGVYMSTAQKGTAFSDQDYAALGFHLQAGYLIDGRYQPVARYAMINPEGSDNNLQEVLGGLSIYFFHHGLKWQNEAGALISESAAGNQTDIVARSQLQLSF